MSQSHKTYYPGWICHTNSWSPPGSKGLDQRSVADKKQLITSESTWLLTCLWLDTSHSFAAPMDCRILLLATTTTTSIRHLSLTLSASLLSP